jgi:hypothetical protein
MRFFFVLCLMPAQAWACSCMVSPTGDPPCQSAWRYDAVFTGTVTAIADPGPPLAPPGPPAPSMPFPQRKVRIRITEALVGLDADQKEVVIETGLGGGDCGYGFQRGLAYIVYASKKSDGALSTGICSPTRLAENAGEVLEYFHQLAHAAPVAEIRVTAIDAHGSWRPEPGGRQPRVPALEGVRVTVDGPGVHESAVTDAAGRHIFSGLPPGEYKVDGSLDGYAIPNALRPVQVHAKGCAEFALPLQLDRTVMGRIFDKSGQPAPGVTVEAVPTRPRYENELPMALDSATTDAHGGYELRRLGTGDYYLGISLTLPVRLENPYTRWFYPGLEDPAAAGIVHVSEKPEVLRYDLTLPDRQRERTIQGTVYWPDGRPAEGARVNLEDPRWPGFTSNIAITTDKDGRFTAQALDGTRYRIHAVIFVSEPVSAEPVPIAPGTNPLDLKLVLTRKGYPPRDAVGKGSNDWRPGIGPR